MARLGRLSNWIGVITFFFAVFGAISWPASTIESVNKFGWGGVVILALLLTCLLLLSLAAFLAAFRKFRPLAQLALPETGSSQPSQQGVGAYDIETRQNEIKKVLDQEIINLKKDFTKRLREMDDILKYLENTMVSTQEKTNALRVDVRGAFSAQHSQDIYKGMVDEIDKMIDNLSDPVDKKDEFPDWQTWTLHYERFKSRLNHLAHLVEEYVDVKEIIFNVPHEKYKSQYWKFNDSGLSDDQKHDYKTFRIISANYSDARSKMYSAILNAVYRGF